MSDGDRSGDSDGDSDGGDLPPWLEDLGRTSAANEGGTVTVVDGGAEQRRCTPEGMASKYRPYPTLTFGILAIYIQLASLTRAQQKLLFSCLRYTDEYGNGLNPADVPACADHFERDARLLTPLVPVTETKIEDKNGFTTSVVGFSPAALLQRRLESPDAAKGILSNLEGHVLTEAEREANGVVVEHLTLVATKPAGGRRRGFLHGTVAAALMGLESLCVGPSGRMEEISVGEPVMVASAGGGPEGALPYRLTQIVWVKDRGELVPSVSPFLTTSEAQIKRAPPQTEGAPAEVWEVVDGGEEVGISRILGRCDVVPLGQGDGAGSSSSGKVLCCAGFIRRSGKDGYKKVWDPSGQPQVLPWRFEGLDRLFFNRRAPGVRSNTTSLPVFNFPVVVFTDASNFSSEEVVLGQCHAFRHCLDDACLPAPPFVVGPLLSRCTSSEMGAGARRCLRDFWQDAGRVPGPCVHKREIGGGERKQYWYFLSKKDAQPQSSVAWCFWCTQARASR